MTVKDTARRLAVHARRAGMIAVALLAAAIVTSLSVDLGAPLRARAEAAASKQIERTVTIGGLSVRLFDGRFLVRDVRVAGLEPTSEPFFAAREIQVAMPLGALLRRQVFVSSVEMTDWRMVVETFPGGRHNFPRLTSNRPSSGPSRFSTSVGYVHAYRGHFRYVDHGTPWSTDVPNLDITVMKLAGYRGTSSSTGGVVRIQSYEPMASSLRTWFRIDNGTLYADRIELDTDGAESLCTGVVDLKRWPEQTYQIMSDVQLPRMREIFWARDTFSLSGEAQFTGTFHLFKGGRELKGDFYSADAGLNAYRFPDLEGSLVWTANRFEVTRARSRFYGGVTDFTYVMDPIGTPVPTVATFDVTYTDVDLQEFSDAMAFDGIRLAGRASGRNLLSWPLRGFDRRQGRGNVTVVPPPGTTLQSKTLPVRLPDHPIAHVYGDPFPPLPPVPIGGALAYEVGPEWIDIAPSRVASPTTYVEFQGRTAYGARSVIPFHVTSTDWQDSDRILAGIMTAFGAPTRPVELGGGGTFDGVLLKDITRPRIEGLFVGRRMRAWDVEWGDGQSPIVVENAYLDVKDAFVRHEGAELRATGRFALGFPRKDKGEEINARIRLTGWPLEDLRHAFVLDEYPMFGRVDGEYHLYGEYLGPHGFGRMTVTDGTAYDEQLASTSASLRFVGPGVWLDGIEIRKGATGLIRGAAHVEWAGTYAFNVDARLIPVESVQLLAFPEMPLTGTIEFSAGGSGTFLEPTYEVKGRIRDLFVKDEGIGQFQGRIVMKGDEMSFELEGGSSRLAVSGTGRMVLLGDYAGELQFRFTDTSFDPYLRVLAPDLSPFVSLVASGTVRAAGSFASVNGVAARLRFDRVDMRLFDYQLQNDGPIDIGVQESVVRILKPDGLPATAQALRLTGADTSLGVSGEIDLAREQVALRAAGDTNLGVLQAFFKDLRSSGRAALVAEVHGPFSGPSVSGLATLSGGRFRHMAAPHAIEDVNGRVTFAGRNIRFDDLRAKVARGDVRFGGRIGLDGFSPSRLDLTATGEAMELRYPAGFRSLVDADLALRGTLDAPRLSGTVQVRSAVLKKRIDLGSGMVELGAAAGVGGSSAAAPTGLPLTFDIRLIAPSTLEIDNNLARIVASADLTLRGTYDKPALFGRAEVDRGELWFEGKRYLLTRGNIDFTNPTRIEPSFDFEAETRARAPGETYRVTVRILGALVDGTPQRMTIDLLSDPPLPQVDILTLLLGDVGSTQDPELRALQRPDTAEQGLIQARAARLLASPISSNVGRVVEQTFGVDTFQITPMLTDPTQSSSRLSPGARLTIGKRISDRVYLTYSRSLTSAARDQIILLEYDQNDRLSWVVTQNEDRTYALDVRVRHIF